MVGPGGVMLGLTCTGVCVGGSITMGVASPEQPDPITSKKEINMNKDGKVFMSFSFMNSNFTV
jgi:hypothetical protein